MKYTHQYFPITPQRPVVVTELYTVHYFENFKNYFFPGERHNFWEMVYVDRGEIIVETDRLDGPLRMEQGDLLLHRPNEFHSFYANDIVPHNAMVLSFSSHSPAMEYFEENPFFHTRSALRNQLSLILEEAKTSFDVPLGDPNVPLLQRLENAPFGGEQVIVSTLELVLISLLRRQNVRTDEEAAIRAQTRLSASYVQRALAFMKENLTRRITLDDICASAAISRPQLQKMFRRQTGESVMRYLAELRIEEAKFLIRSRNMNFTEIAERLCYSSVHHFSRQFHEVVGMSPSEYVASIRALTEGG